MIRRALLLLLVAASAFADAGVWGSRGISRRFVARENLVYDVDGRGVTVYDISDPAHIREAGLARTDDETRDAAFAGDATLAVATSKGVELYATSTMKRTLAIAENGGAHRIAATASRIAAGTPAGVTIWNHAGDVMRRIPFAHRVNALAFVGELLYVAVNEEALYVLDPRGSAVATISINAFDLALSGNTLYAAAGSNGIAAIDVGTRSVTYAGAGNVNMIAIAVAGTRVFAMQSPDTVYAFDGLQLVSTFRETIRAIGSGAGRLIVAPELGVPLRVHDASSFATLGELHALAGPVSGVATDGTFAYVVDPPKLRVLDISSPSTPAEVASLEIAGIQDRIRIKNGLAVIYGRGDVNLVDLTNPYKPKVLAVYHSFGFPPSNAAIARDTIVEANDFSGLHVVDYTSFARPEQIAGRVWHYLDVLADGDAVYAFSVGKMVVLDITNRNKVVDRTDVVLPVEQAELANGLVIVRGQDGFRIFSRDDPFAPVEAAMVPVTKPGQFGAGDGAIYFAMDGALQRIDLAAPSVEATGWRVTSAMQISVAGGKVVVADRYSLRVYGTPSAPPPPPPPARRRAL